MKNNIFKEDNINDKMFNELFNSLPKEDFPQGLHNSIIKEIQEINQKEKIKMFDFKKFLKPKFLGMTFATLCVAIITFSFTLGVLNVGRGNKYTNNCDMANEECQVEMAVDGSSNRDQSSMKVKHNSRSLKPMSNDLMIPLDDELKIIKTANIKLDTDNFKNTMDSIKVLVKNSNGYIQNSNEYVYDSRPSLNIYLKRGHITLRVPKNSYGSIKDQISMYGEIKSISDDAQNVTEQYSETESRIKSLEIQQDRLFKIMEKATKVEDLIKLEQRLNSVRTDLEIHKSNIKNWDKKVQFSTIHVDVKEVISEDEIQPVNEKFNKRVSRSFISSINRIREACENFVVWLVGNILNIIVLIGVIIIFIYILVKVIKKIIIKKEGDDHYDE